MKSTRHLLILTIAFAWQAGGVCLVSAQNEGSTNAPSVHSPSPASALTPDERKHLRKVKKEVLANNPDLKAEDEALNQQRDDLDGQGTSASPDAHKELMAKWLAHQQKIRAAALKIDPTLAPIYAKLDAWRQQHVKPTPGG